MARPTTCLTAALLALAFASGGCAKSHDSEVGTGITCDDDLLCPQAMGGKDNICGRLYDIETDSEIRATRAAVKHCGEGGAGTDGPCLLAVDGYDALGFWMGLTNPLPHDPVYVDDCGRFRITNSAPPTFGFMAVGVDDAAGQDLYRRTGITFPATPGGNETFNGVKAYVISRDTDQRWSNDAGLTGGTFVDRGAYMALFYHGRTPVSGVTITASGTPDAAHDYYFSDTNDPTRSTIAPAQSVTGQNGAGLMILIGGVSQMSGTGGETSGCSWPVDLGTSVPNALYVQTRIEMQGTTVCP